MLVVVGIFIAILLFAVFKNKTKGANAQETINNGTKVDKPKEQALIHGNSEKSSGCVKSSNREKVVSEMPLGRSDMTTVQPTNEIPVPQQEEATSIFKKPCVVECVPFLDDVFCIKYSQKCVVNYDLECSKQLEYPLLRSPQRGTGIKLPIHGRSGRRGACEKKLCTIISKYKLSGFMDNLTMFAKDCPYEPDLAYINENKGIFVDIEVDEPYSGWEKTPIHYTIGKHTVDDKRNLCFTERGWLVLRFSEKQVFEQPKSCLKYVYQIIRRIDSSVTIPSPIVDACELKVESMWTKEQAYQKIQNKERENMLGISDFVSSGIVSKIVSSDYEGAEEIENEVENLHDEREWNLCSRQRRWDKYIDNYPMGRYVSEAKAKMDDELWNECLKVKEYERYLRTSKLQNHSIEAKRLKAIEDKRKAEAVRKEKERLEAIKEENERKKLLEELERKRRDEEERKRREAEVYTRQHVSTAQPSLKTPSSRGYA